MADEDGELEKRIERHIEAIEWHIEHPEAPLPPNLRAFVNNMKRQVEEELEREAKLRIGLRRRSQLLTSLGQLRCPMLTSPKSALVALPGFRPQTSTLSFLAICR